MNVVIFYLEPETRIPKCEEFINCHDRLKAALDRSEELRALGKYHITISVENPNMVGDLGVNGVMDNKLPNGDPYTWKKRR